MANGTNGTSRIIIFFTAAIFFFGLLFFAADPVQATCVCSGTPCTRNETDTGRDPITGASCATDSPYCCEASSFPTPDETPTPTPTPGGPCAGKPDGTACNQIGGGAAGTCDNGDCVVEEPITGPTDGSGGGTGWSLGSVSGFGLPDGSIFGIISGILSWLLGILGLIGVVGFLISGILYLTSAGDEDQIEKAKKAMTWSIVGVVVGLIGVVIIQAIDYALRGFSMF